MLLRLRNTNDVRVFAVTISLVALICNVVLQMLILPHDLYQQVVLTSSIVTLVVTIPLAFFVGLRMMDIHLLTVELENAARYDNLTGAFTRASFYQQAEKIETAPLTLIFADIDRFKGINDKFGHKAGDAVLQSFAKTLINSCRKDDIVARFGGEEFAILLKGTGLVEGISAAQRICKHVREMVVKVDGKPIQITVSFGVTEVGTDDGIDIAIQHSDLAVYRAKREGRDRVCFYTSECETGTA